MSSRRSRGLFAFVSLLISAVAAVLWTHAGDLFMITSVASATIAPTIPVISAKQLEIVAAVFAALLIGRVLGRIFADIEDRLDGPGRWRP